MVAVLEVMANKASNKRGAHVSFDESESKRSRLDAFRSTNKAALGAKKDML